MSKLISHKYKIRSSLIIMSVGIILLMFMSNRVLYVRYFPKSLLIFTSIICFIIYLRYNYKELLYLSVFKFICLILLSTIWIYDQLLVLELNAITFFYLIIKICCAWVILSLSYKDNIWLYNVFIHLIQIIVGVALIGWILWLLNFPLPNFTDTSDAYYIHTIYYIFNLNGYPNMQLFPRFAGPFLEPGHLGTMCIYILFCNQFNLKKLGNIVLLLGVLLSLSLAAYGLLVGAALLTLYHKEKFGLCFGLIGFFLLIGLGATLYNGGDNALNRMIVMRLEMDESGDIAGNNRTSYAFDKAYDKYLTSNDTLFGVGRKAYGTKENGSDNITIGCATYKRYFFLRGWIGSLLILLFLFFYCYKYRNKKSIGFLIIYIVANCIRDYPNMEMWLYLYLMAIPILGNPKSNHIHNKRVYKYGNPIRI